MDYNKILRKEYNDAGAKPLQIVLHGKKLLIPYMYTIDTDDTQEIAKKFLGDFYDVNDILEEHYRKHGETPLYVEYNKRKYVVPRAYAEENLSAEQIAQKVFNKCLGKYKRAISVVADINKIKPDEDRIVSISYNKYKENKQYYRKLVAKKIMNKVVRGIVLTGNFLAKGAYFVGKKAFGIEPEDLKKYCRRTMAGLMLVGGIYLTATKTDVVERIKDKIENNRDNKKLKKIKFAEEFAEKCDGDKYGNLRTLDKAYDDLSVVLAAVEGFYPEAFDDGLGNYTIGYGSTFYIDENGKSCGKVKPGDEISMEDAFIQKQRYIAYYMLPCLAKVNRSLSEKEIIGLMTTGFCIGHNALNRSDFLKKLSANEKDAWQSLSVYGKQAGVRKRTALTAAYVKGEISTNDLLNFGWKNGENIYQFSISDFYECRPGTQKPYKNKDGYCRGIYYDNVGKCVRDVIAKGVKYPVRDIMPDFVLKSVEKKNTFNFNQIVQNFTK